MSLITEITPVQSSAAIEYIKLVHKPESDLICFGFLNSETKQFQQAFRSLEDAIQPQFLEKLQSSNQINSVYMSLNSFKSPQRTKANVAAIRAIGLDLDKDGRANLNRLFESKKVIEPNIVFETSPDKFQAVWSVENISVEEAERISRALAAEFGGDPAATDAARVMRLPGFKNCKYPEKPEVEVVHLADRKARLTAIDFKLILESTATKTKAEIATTAPISAPLDVNARVPRGEHDRTLTRYAGVLRAKGLNAEEMEPVLVRYVEEKFDGYGSDFREMVTKVCRSIGKKPAGDPTPKVTIGGRLPGEPVVSAGTPTPSEPVIDTSEGSLRPVFPHHVMEGTTLYEGLVKPAVDNSSKYAEFVFLPAVQMMLNYLSGKVRIAMQETNLNLFVGLVSPPGEFFKSSSCALSHDYFKSMGLSAKYSKSLPNADGRVIVMQTGSSEGFGLTMSEINGKNAILFNDELGKLVAKAGIENSSLPHDLLTWYESGDFGNTVKSRKDSFAFEAKSYVFGWQWCTTTRGFNRHWPKIAGAVSGMEDRMFFVVSPEKPKPAGAYHVPPMEEAAKVTYSAIETATLKGVYEFAVWDDVNSIANGMNPRTMQMLFALALYFAIDLKRDKIDLDCLTRAKELVAFRDQSIRFLAPIEADNEQGRVQQEITRELRQNKGKMKTRDLIKELHAERYGTDRWKAAYWGLVKEGVIADFSEKSKSGQTCRMTALLVLND